MSHDAYLEHPSLNNSTIKAMLDSPWAYSQMANHKREATPAMRFGTLAHMAILEPKLFEGSVGFVPADIKPTTVAFKKYKDPTDEQQLKTYVSQDQYEAISKMRDNIKEHTEACALLTGGAAEVSCFWTDQKHGIKCKARCDYISNLNCIVDLKTTSGSIDPASFAKMLTVDNFAYAMQAAHYTRFGRLVCGSEPLDFAWVLVQTKAPYEVAVFRATQQVLDYGDAWRDKGVAIYKEAQALGRWPKRVEGICDAQLPAWAKFPAA